MNTKRGFAAAAIGTIFFGLVLVGPSFAADKVTDADITMWVKSALLQDERIDASQINVATEDGIVTLSGEVFDLTAKEYAEREAMKITGVLGVINQIVVESGWRSDADIELVVRRRILNSAVINSEDISVSSLDGHVTLFGEVDSWPEWEEAQVLAGSVGGVGGVVNNLVIATPPARPDQEIKNDAVAALARDVYTTGVPITVAVKDGVITLTGTVGNAYEKRRAGETVSWISNVRGVDNLLVVDWVQDTSVRNAIPEPSDAELQKAVRAELDQDWRLIDADITSTVSRGHVVLDGSVPNHYEKRIAEMDARDVVGVGWVTNNVFARADTREDSLVRGDVQFDLDTDAIVGSFGINASVVKGTVSLFGRVHTWYQKFHAGELAANVKGVKLVINDIVVARTNWKTDAELTKDIKSRLTWNWTTWWVHNDIGVTVDNGLATLTGDVNTWSQRKEAANVVIQTPGIWKLDNRLTVDGYDYPWDEWYTRSSSGSVNRNDSHHSYSDFELP